MRLRQYVWQQVGGGFGYTSGRQLRLHTSKSKWKEAQQEERAALNALIDDLLNELDEELSDADFVAHTALGSGIVRYDLKLLHIS